MEFPSRVDAFEVIRHRGELWDAARSLLHIRATTHVSCIANGGDGAGREPDDREQNAAVGIKE